MSNFICAILNDRLSSKASSPSILKFIGSAINNPGPSVWFISHAWDRGRGGALVSVLAVSGHSVTWWMDLGFRSRKLPLWYAGHSDRVSFVRNPPKNKRSNWQRNAVELFPLLSFPNKRNNNTHVKWYWSQEFVLSYSESESRETKRKKLYRSTKNRFD